MVSGIGVVLSGRLTYWIMSKTHLKKTCKSFKKFKKVMIQYAILMLTIRISAVSFVVFFLAELN